MGWPPVTAVHVAESDQILEMASVGSRQDWLVDWMWDVERERRIKVMLGLGPEQLEGWSCHLISGRLRKEQGFVWRLFDFERIQSVILLDLPEEGMTRSWPCKSRVDENPQAGDHTSRTYTLNSTLSQI